MNKGLLLSVILHIMLFVIMIFGMPSLLDKRISNNEIIPVEIIKISDITNIKTKKYVPKKPDKPKEQLSKDKAKPAMAKKAPKPVPRPKVPPKPTLKPTEKPKPKEVKEVVKAPKPKPQPKKEEKPEDAWGSILKSIDKIEQDIEEEVSDEEVTDLLAKSDSEFNDALPMSISEKAAIKQQISKNWRVLKGAADAGDIIVVLRIKLARDGSVTDVNLENSGNSAYFDKAVSRAKNAIYASSPLKNLPEEKYDIKEGWKEIKMTFTPEEIIY